MKFLNLIFLLLFPTACMAGGFSGIANTSTLQSGSTFYVSSGTVSGKLSAQNIVASTRFDPGLGDYTKPLVINGNSGSNQNWISVYDEIGKPRIRFNGNFLTAYSGLSVGTTDGVTIIPENQSGGNFFAYNGVTLSSTSYVEWSQNEYAAQPYSVGIRPNQTNLNRLDILSSGYPPGPALGDLGVRSVIASTVTVSSGTVTTLNTVSQNIYGNASNSVGIAMYQNSIPLQTAMQVEVGDPSSSTSNTLYSLSISSALNQSSAVSYITGANFNPASYRFGTSNGTSTATMLTVSTTSISAFGGVFYSTYTNSQELVVMSTNNVSAFSVSNTGGGSTQFGANTFISLGTPSNGTFEYCSDCTVTTPATCTANLLSSCVCAGSGTGAFAKRLNGAWYCQ